MKNRREYIILFIVIALISAYLIVQKKGEVHYSLPRPEKIDGSSVSEVRLTRGGAVVTIVREDEDWLILPRKYPADASKVDGMIEAAGNIKLTALASESGNFWTYELDEKNIIMVELSGDKGILRAVAIGKPTSSFRHTFVRLGDDRRVFHAEGNLKNIFDNTAADLREKTVMAIDGEISELTLTSGKKSVTIVRTSAPVSEEPALKQEEEHVAEEKWQTADGDPVRGKDVEEIIGSLKSLDCDGFLEDRTTEGFTSPSYTVVLKGLKEYSLSFYEKEDTKYAAVSSENEYPFYLSEWKAEKIMKDPDALVALQE